MELVLTIIAVFGILLFIIGYLAFVFAGFRQNFITGIISALPVLNIVTVPALWRKTSKKLVFSVLGVAIAASSWFFGADKNIKSLLFHSNSVNMQAKFKNDKYRGGSQVAHLSKPSISVTPIPKQVVGTTVIRPLIDKVASSPFANMQRNIDESELLELPDKALYRFSFETVPVNNATALKGRVVQIIAKNNMLIEGRVSKASANSIFLLSGNRLSIENEYPVANIKQLRLMVKKAANK